MDERTPSGPAPTVASASAPTRSQIQTGQALTAAAPTATEVQTALQKILVSKQFSGSQRLCKFLTLVVDLTLAGDTGSVKEYTLAREVFDRGSDYDPRVDSIVRVEAQRLRQKLKQYYESAGRGDDVRIHFQPGSYVPLFLRHTVAETAAVSAGLDQKPLDHNTIAVLPFINLSADPEQQLFCNGITEEVIHKLTAIPELRVLGMSTAAALQRNPAGPAVASRALGVGTLIEGSVRQAGNILRISATAIDSASGQTLWARSFDRQTEDIFAVQEEIAHELAAALHVQLRPAHETAAAPPAPPNLEAYRLYLSGRHKWDEGTPERCHAALRDFQRAATYCPDYALPYTGIADAYQWMAFMGWRRPREVLPKARRAALEALRVDPNLAEAYASLAGVLFHLEWDWPGAEATAISALDLNPSCSFAHAIIGRCALVAGRVDEALQSFIRAWELDPLSHRMTLEVGVAHFFGGRIADCEHWLQEARDLSPQNSAARLFQLILYFVTERWEDARREISSGAAGPANDVMDGMEAAVLARCGQRDEALDRLQKMREASDSRYMDPIALMMVQIGLEEYEDALDSLEGAVMARSPRAAFLRINPLLRPLREKSRFQVLVSALRL